MKVKFKDGYQAEAFICEGNCTWDKPSSLIQGKWSTIYDQGIKLELESGQRFITNFRYNAKSSLSADPTTDLGLMFADLKTSDYGSFDSVCSKTMVGFVQTAGGAGSTMTEHKVSCFYGSQDK